MTHIACGYFFGSGVQNDVVSKDVGFYAIMAAICALITWFLSKDRKRIRLLSAFLVGSTWPMSFPVALLVSLF